MATEIELKYLIKRIPKISSTIKREVIKQGYLHRSGIDGKSKSTIRVRQLGDKGFLTIKGEKIGLSQPEFEYEIPLTDTIELFKLCEPGILDKTRYYIPYGKYIIELDIFEGKNKGLVIAEIELESENDSNKIIIPDWFGENISKDVNYSNAELSKI
jgi:adenylate cyclase